MSLNKNHYLDLLEIRTERLLSLLKCGAAEALICNEVQLINDAANKLVLANIISGRINNAKYQTGSSQSN